MSPPITQWNPHLWYPGKDRRCSWHWHKALGFPGHQCPRSPRSSHIPLELTSLLYHEGGHSAAFLASRVPLPCSPSCHSPRTCLDIPQPPCPHIYTRLWCPPGHLLFDPPGSGSLRYWKVQGPCQPKCLHRVCGQQCKEHVVCGQETRRPQPATQRWVWGQGRRHWLPEEEMASQQESCGEERLPSCEDGALQSGTDPGETRKHWANLQCI